MRKMSIDGRLIGRDYPPFIIAEMSANHGGDFDRAIRIIDAAADSGADAIKFQAYTPDSLTLDCQREDFLIQADNLWTGRRLHELYGEGSTPYDWFPDMYKRARDKGIIPFSSPFDVSCLDMLENLNSPVYKIASFEIVDLELIAACAKTGKPLIMSTGMCTEQDIQDAVETARSNGCDSLTLLKCNSSYPADPAESNLSRLSDMAEKYDVVVGYSDHTLGHEIPVMSIAAGACLIEKHFIDNRFPETVDSAFSATPDQMKELVEKCNLAFKAMGDLSYGPSEREKDSLIFRRSLYFVKPLKKGEQVTREHVRSVRPGYGLAPKHLPQVIGKCAKVDLEFGARVSWDVLED